MNPEDIMLCKIRPSQKVKYFMSYMRYLKQSNSSWQRVEWRLAGAGGRETWGLLLIMDTEFQLGTMKRSVPEAEGWWLDADVEVLYAATADTWRWPDECSLGLRSIASVSLWTGSHGFISGSENHWHMGFPGNSKNSFLQPTWIHRMPLILWTNSEGPKQKTVPRGSQRL